MYIPKVNPYILFNPIAHNVCIGTWLTYTSFFIYSKIKLKPLTAHKNMFLYIITIVIPLTGLVFNTWITGV